MQTVKTVISIQENLFEQAEALARQMKVSAQPFCLSAGRLHSPPARP